MNGVITKFYLPEKTSGRVSIPQKVAKSLKWYHLDEINLTVEVVDGKKGLFLYKKEEK